MINLDVLLNEDELNPEQQKFVKGIVQYRIKHYCPYYRYSDEAKEQLYKLNRKDIYGSKVNSYKHVMFHLILTMAKEYKDKTNIYWNLSELRRSKDEFFNVENISLHSQIIYNALIKIREELSDET